MRWMENFLSFQSISKGVVSAMDSMTGLRMGKFGCPSAVVGCIITSTLQSSSLLWIPAVIVPRP